MDPLSIAASVLSLAMAVSTIGKGLAFFRSLARAPADFHNFLNELATLQAVMAQTEHALSNAA